ncbi:MAG TPA: 50S ribosomal protein L25 [Ktedonobacteraceae bacterium]
MAKQVELAVSPREVTGKATKKLRKAGIIPANIFGHGETSQSVQLTTLDFEQLRREHHATGVVTLKLAGEPKMQTVLIRRVQRDAIHGHVLHIDFLRVSLRDRITARVTLHFQGTPPAVKLENGVLLHLVDMLEVECEAGDIVDAIDVDVSSLEHIDDAIPAKDVKLPDKFTLLTDPEELVAKIAQTRAEKTDEAEAAPAEAASETAPAQGEGRKE